MAEFTWTAEERESFFDAIARHRRACWRVAVASHFANLVVAVIVAAMMAPLFFAALCLGFDVVNLFHHVPNLVAAIGRVIGPLVDAPETASIARWVAVALVATAPGLLWMGVLLTALRRMLRVSAMFDSGLGHRSSDQVAGNSEGGDLRTRAPDPTALPEQRIANVIEEMAVAANLPAPRVVITDQGANAAVFGRDEAHATIVVSQALLRVLDRAEMQGIAAHLVGSIANGDMRIGLQVTSTLSLFGLISRLGTVVSDRGAWRPLLRIVLGLWWPSRKTARRLAEELADPFAPTPEEAIERRNQAMTGQEAAKKAPDDWRSMLWLPLAGSIVMASFFSGLVSLFLLGPLLSLAWRQRKYMADATAVQLTRDPNTLSEALEKMGGSAGFAPWAAHLAVVGGPGSRGLFSQSAVPMFPSNARRLTALAKMGAHLHVQPRRMPLAAVLIIVPLFAVIGVLVGVALFLLAWLSIPLTALFLGIPFAIVHLLLRWIGG